MHRFSWIFSVKSYGLCVILASKKVVVMAETFPDEWTQEEYLREKKRLEKEGTKVILIDTILSPIERADTVVYNPYELSKEPEGSVFVFYCDTGKSTKERLEEFRRKFPKYHCVSLFGGRGYWRKYMEVRDD